MNRIQAAMECRARQKAKELIGEIYILRCAATVKANHDLAVSLRSTSLSIAAHVAKSYPHHPVIGRMLSIDSAVEERAHA